MTSGRHLAWPGTYNVVDLGGLPTREGRRTRRGAFVRSEHLDGLGGTGWEALRAHGVRTCVDLRSSWERTAPGRAPPDDVGVVHAPLEEGLLADPEFRRWAETGLLGCALYFEPYLRRWPERLAASIRAMATAPPGGVLYHCQRGRDRTGLVTLVLLSLAGVPTDVVVADHLATDERLAERGLALGHISTDGEADLFIARGTTAAAVLTDLVDGLDAEDLLRTGGLSGEEVATLRARLVVDASG